MVAVNGGVELPNASTTALIKGYPVEGQEKGPGVAISVLYTTTIDFNVNVRLAEDCGGDVDVLGDGFELARDEADVKP